MEMADAAALVEATGSRFSDLELIGRGSFGDVYKGLVWEILLLFISSYRCTCILYSFVTLY